MRNRRVVGSSPTSGAFDFSAKTATAMVAVLIDRLIQADAQQHLELHSGGAQIGF
jgi:hypothetical protein